MGAKTALLVYADGDVAQALREATEPDRAATEALVARLLPGLEVAAVGDGSLGDVIRPPKDTVYAGVFRGLTVVCADDLLEIQPTSLRAGWLAEGAGRRVILHSMHSVSDFLGFAVWGADGTLERALCLSPGLGVLEDRGERLPFEQAYWAGAHPVELDEDDDEDYPLPFHPLDLGEEALAALFGFVREGLPPPDMPDISRVPLAGFRLGTPRLTLQRSHGLPIAQPTAFEVDAEVRRLGVGLDYVSLDLGGEQYLQAAAGGQYGTPAGRFAVERREGAPDRHFRCEIGTLDEVAGIFRGYLADPDDRAGHPWEQLRL